MLSQDVTIPVYFLLWEKVLQNIISNVDVITATNDANYNKKETATDGNYLDSFSIDCNVCLEVVGL